MTPEEKEVIKVYELFWTTSFSRGKGVFDKIFSMVHPDVGGFGTGKDEVVKNIDDLKKLIRREFDEVTVTMPVNFIWSDAKTYDSISIIAGELEIIIDQLENIRINGRCTSIFKKHLNKWKLLHLHVSLPASEQTENESFPLDAFRAKQFELEKQVAEKTADLLEKNRELEIEAALEKVRAIAMAMRERQDMLDVCRTIALQLKSLGLKEIRNVQTAIFYKDRGTYMNYEYYAKHKKMIITETDYTNNEIHNEFALKMMKGKGEFFTTRITDLKKWLAYQKTTNVFIDSYLETSSELNYYWFSLGPVAQGISSYVPLTESEIELFKRFLTVFELAYRRFLDIEKAEAQAHEAKIETALERVRVRAMAMQSSHELKDVIQVIYKQFAHLDMLIEHTGFIVDYKVRDDMHIWLADKNGAPSEISIPYFDSPHWNSFNEAREKGLNFFANHLNFEEKNSFYKRLFKHIPDLPEKSKEFYFGCPGLAISTVLLDNVGLYMENFSGTPYTDEENETLMRFGKVFQQTYTRFLDLQKAEAQAREARIETALERVRAKAMAMHNSDDLAQTVDVFFKELRSLDVTPRRCGVTLIDEETHVADLTVTTAKGKNTDLKMTGKLTLAGHPILEEVYNRWKRQKEYHPVLKGMEIKEYYNVMNPEIEYPDSTSDEIQYGHYFYFKEGGVFAWTDKELPESTLNIFRKFTSVLSLTYRRYLDLMEAEAQAREAQIEAALERVRAKTMAMYKSDELADIAAVVFQQLINLGIDPNRIYIGIIKNEKSTCEFWITDEDGTKVSSGFTVDLTENISFKKMYDGWVKRKKSITIEMQGKELKDYFKYLTSLDIPFKGGRSQKRRLQYIAYFSQGLIGVASPDETKQETLQLLERFAAVFNLTYTRFNDLIQAEAQNKIIQAENERKTKELEEARQLQLSMLPKKLPNLPHLDIAVYMQTATEVGGDYYDFVMHEDGSLNICLGDATGHGMKAGIMVSSMKSIFTTNAHKMDIEQFFENANTGIKSMNLSRMMMGLVMVNINANKFKLINAGMPPLFLFRQEKEIIEELKEHGLPIGAMNLSQYSVTEILMNKGDVLLLMSDGMPELHNQHNEMYGYERLSESFKKVEKKSPDKIISFLKNECSGWVNNADPDDDVTFVVIKVK